MDGFEKRKLNKMKDIVLSARQLFTERGVTDVTIAEIAKKANVSQVSIYNYFGGKQELMCAVLQNIIDETIELYNNILSLDISFREKIEKMIFSKLTAIDFYNPDFISEIMKSENKVVNDFANNLYNEVSIPFMVRIIEMGKKEGAIQVSLSHEAILFYIQMYLNSIRTFNLNDILKLYSEIMDLFFYGLMGNTNNQIK